MAKQNSMDVIKIKYHGSDEAVDLVDFLNMKEGLNPEEIKLQEALQFLYDTNAKESLFEKFPDWYGPDKPLTIDCRDLKESDGFSIASFSPTDNRIAFHKSLEKIELVNTLAHELKHAEQSTEGTDELSNLEFQQVQFLKEAQAYIFGNYVQMLFLQKDGSVENLDKKMFQTADFATEKILPDLINWMKEVPEPGFVDKNLEQTPQKNYKELEQQLIPIMLQFLYTTRYKLQYDKNHSIKEGDKELSSLPDGFPLKLTDAIKEMLENIPKGKWISADDLTLVPPPPGFDDTSTIEQQLYQMLNAKFVRNVEKALKQQNEYGNGVFSQLEYSKVLDKLKRVNAVPTMIDLFNKKNAKGDSWLGVNNKLSILNFLLEQKYDQVQELVQDLKNVKDMNGLLREQPTSNMTEEELQTFYAKNEKVVVLFLDGWKNYPKDDNKEVMEAGTYIMTRAIQYGHAGIVKNILSKWQECKERPLSVRHSLVNIVFKQISEIDKEIDIRNDYMQNRVSEILSSFLDLKDENGQHVISSGSIESLKNQLSAEETPMAYNALKQYQEQHPTDVRFKGVEGLEDQTHNQANNHNSLSMELSKFANNEKRGSQDNTVTPTQSVDKQKEALNTEPRQDVRRKNQGR